MIGTTLIGIPQWGNFTLIEAIWLFSGIIAVIFCSLHMYPLIGDYKVAQQTGRETVRIVSASYVRREIIRLCQGLIITSIGIYSALQPPAIPGPAVVSVVGLVITAGIFSLSFTTALMSWWDFRTRLHVLALIDQGKNGIHENLPEP